MMQPFLVIDNAQMIIHENTLLSEDLFEKHFICDLSKCKGACCVEGDFGAPVTPEEIETLNTLIPDLAPYLSEAGMEVISTKGVSEKDRDGDLVTTCLPTGECSFAIYENGILGCGIEKAWKDGAVAFQKPLSCHLYPIRVNQVAEYDALNYHRWEICKPACNLGDQHKVPIFRFLKGALIRAYGQEWYDELDAIADALNE